MPRRLDFLQLPLLLAAALATTAVLILACGYAPGPALTALFRGSVLSWDGWRDSLTGAIPLIFTGLAVAIGFRGGALNIGGEGQYLAGALAAASVAVVAPRLPAAFLLPLLLCAGAIAGAAVAAAAGALRAWRHVPEVISTIMLNFILVQIVSYAVHGPLMEKESGLPQSPSLPGAFRLAPFSPQSDLHQGIWIAILAAALVWLILSRTTLGFRIRATGTNPVAALHAGMPVRRTIIETMAISGALAGLGGAVELSGITHRLYENFSPGYGYTGIAVAMLGRLHPAGVMVAAIFFGALAAGAGEMQRSAQIPSVIVFAIQGVVILLSATRLRGVMARTA